MVQVTDDGLAPRIPVPNNSRTVPFRITGTAMQAPLAILGFILGLVAWWLTARVGFLIGALAMIAPWPWTLLVIKPVNDRLIATDPEKAGPSSRALLLKWGRLHAVRTALSAVAGIAFLSAFLWH